MLYDDPILYFKGLTIFKDFSDGRTFYFLPPEAPRVARTAEGGETGDYALRLVLYRPDPNAPPPAGMEDGGGFLNLDTDLHVTEGLLNDVREEIRRRFGADANLVPVPFTDGSVELVLLGVNRDEPGQPFVREVAGTTVPALFGTQRAAFSTVLDRHGAAVMKAVLEEGGVTMALAIYHLTYAGIGPAYNLKITIDYQRVFDHLDLRLKAGVAAANKSSSFVAKAGFHLLMQELKESRAIKVEEVDPIPGENGRTPTNQEAINEIIGNLMGAKWFKPSLTNAGSMTDLASAASGSGSTGTGSGTTGAGGTGTSTPAATGGHKNAQWTVDSTTPAPLPSDRGVEPFQPATSGTRESLVVRGSGATAKVGPTADALQPHALEGSNRLAVELPEGKTQFVEIKWPAAGGAAGERKPVTWTPGATEGATADRSVTFEAATGTLVIRGDGATAKVGASPTALTPQPIAGNRLTVEVGDGQTQHVEITWPAAPGAEETFHLFYDYDRPLETGNDVTTYNARRPSPAEPAPALRGEQARFLEESRSPTTTRRGPDGLDEWLGTLQSGSNLKLHAHSSFENDDSQEKRRLNERLSQRRLDVARSLIAGRFPATEAVAHGHTDSKNGSVATLANDGAPANSRNGRPQHRVVLITGTKRGGAQTVMRGQLRREPRGGGTGTPESTLRGHLTRGGGGGGGGTGENATSVQASFEVNLEMIKQEERVTAVYELSSRKARTHAIHPQGQLVFDAFDRAKYLIEADGAIAFFQALEIAASTTAQWQLDGIHSIQIQLRYAPAADGGFQRTGELNLTPAKEADTWKSGVLRDQSLAGEPVIYWYEYKVIVNYTQDVALGDQQGAVSSAGVPQADAEGWIRSDARNLVIHPRDITPAMTVNVASGIMHYDLLERVQLVLSYGPYQQNIALSAAKPEHRLVIRPEPGLADAKLRTEGTLFYKDGAQVPLPPQDWKPQELVVVNEPRDNILRVRVILADPADEYERVEVRLRYEHGNRVIEQPFTLKDHAEIKEWAVRLEDPAQRNWRYEATLVKRSGDIDTIAWRDGKNEQLILGVQAVDVIPVQVTWLMPLPSADLIAVKIDLMYEDPDNGVRWTKSELIRQGHSGTFAWPIAIKDERKRSYRYKVTEFRQSGPQERQVQESDSEQLVLL